VPRKYVVLICGILIQACLGSVYAWTVFVPALQQTYGLTATQTQAVFGTAIAAWTLAMIPAGRALPRLGPRVVAGLAGGLFLCGRQLAAMSGGNFWLLWIGMGWLTGSAIGCGYVCALTLFAQWFPTRRGLATGVAVGAFGAGAVLEATLAEGLLQAGWSVLPIFGRIGLGYGLLICAAALGLSAPSRQASRTPSSGLPLGELLAGRRFRLAALGIFAGTFAGLLVIGSLKSIGLSGSLSPTVCTIGVSLFAVGNTCGRIAWGWISDRAGSRAIPISLLLLAAAVLLMYPARLAGATFLPICVSVGFGYGACFVLYAAYVAREYGPAQVAGIYPLVFLAFGVSGIMGPMIGGWLVDVSGGHLVPIVVAASVTLAGAAGTWRLLHQSTHNSLIPLPGGSKANPD
jgi:MFS transporter, OFA family, oxalate/formate antiporter